jgi:hypothetical protein
MNSKIYNTQLANLQLPLKKGKPIILAMVIPINHDKKKKNQKHNAIK